MDLDKKKQKGFGARGLPKTIGGIEKDIDNPRKNEKGNLKNDKPEPEGKTNGQLQKKSKSIFQIMLQRFISFVTNTISFVSRRKRRLVTMFT